ncbi:MAG: ATP synthase delta chain [uncultured bacterium]|nr:MAG: ATP synthase delta chain [uncultured bacterium]OGT25554.1 MAG: ATP synthase F1 subunit delta [Gammaproteobacteria bacterium RIFCSPHIGHO2_02_FULL_42_43]OGT28838.1 MAG: ATP synthase F1 subunit delta [Gammaproteobacteria bacterium RIFCSPHIGHO2_01_FULL_42_8]OGT51508.1 MAG: ATP synthase F1 subunit delta [Gammaproteobacteria bacterium RIFCSPHIGHO2_12_FULL_41_25]OGT62209.1 MAG: ATP synthase F1 subunit delta [Gammaproteobacteria bacterium RIFCSPLOWO2_02_FULL_42_14]OGT85882.1 MAG: ATP synthase 
MINTISVARPYANAAFTFADEKRQLSVWSHALHVLSFAVQDDRVAALLKNPNYSSVQWCELLANVLQAALTDAAAKSVFIDLTHFLQLLAEHKRLQLLPDISVLFEESLAKKSDYLALTVTSAKLLNAAEQKSVTQQLAEKLNQELHIHFLHDKAVMAGLLVRSKDWVMDASVAGQLRRMKSDLMRTA